MFSNLHSSLAPKAWKSSSTSLYSSTENMNAVGSSPNRSDRKRQAPLPPSPSEPKSSGKPNSDSRIVSKYSDANGQLVAMNRVVDSKMPPLPLPDYDRLFPHKRHGIQGQVRWDSVIAEVNRRQNEYIPQLVGEEMSVDGPDLDSPATLHNNKYTYVLDSRAEHPNRQSTQVQGKQSMSSRVSTDRFPVVMTPSKPVPKASHRLVGDANTKQDQSTLQSLPSVERNNDLATNVLVSSNPMVHSREAPFTKHSEDARRALSISINSTVDRKSAVPFEHPSRPTPRDKIKVLPQPLNDIPIAKPRQKLVGKEPVRRTEPEPLGSTPVQQKSRTERRTATTSDLRDIREMRGSQEMLKNTDVSVNSDQPPISVLTKRNIKKDKLDCITEKDSLAHPERTHAGEEQGIKCDELEKCYVPKDNPKDLLSNCNDRDSEKHPDELSPVFQRGFSQRKKKTAPPPSSSFTKGAKGKPELNQQDQAPREEKTVMSAPTQSVMLEDPDESTSCSKQYVRENVETEAKEMWVEDHFTTVSAVPSSAEPSQAFVGEPSPQTVSGGKTLQRAWISPSEMPPGTVIGSSGGGPASTLRRPHPVKPMSSMDSQALISTALVKDLKTSDSALGKIKGAGVVESGPYTQLTQEELITLVVKQQTELSKKDTKISELEVYIDNLLVRVIEEKPSILLGLNSAKQML